MTTVRWILNLAADLELEDPTAFAPSPTLRARIEERGRSFLTLANRSGATIGVEHVEFDPRSASRHRDVHETMSMVQAWSPTPEARRQCETLGTAPSSTILQRVNHRAFAFGLGPSLPDAAFVTSLVALESHLASVAWPRLGWLLKRPFGFSGRARKRLGPDDREIATRGLEQATRRWVESSMAAPLGGLLVEPFVSIDAEFGQHGWLDPEGRLLVGSPTRLVTDPDGAWNHTRSATDDDLLADEAEVLRATLERVGAALHQAGYFGPFGVDSYRYRAESGQLRWQTLGELNARYSMGFFVGFTGDLQREWFARIEANARRSVGGA